MQKNANLDTIFPHVLTAYCSIPTAGFSSSTVNSTTLYLNNFARYYENLFELHGFDTWRTNEAKMLWWLLVVISIDSQNLFHWGICRQVFSSSESLENIIVSSTIGIRIPETLKSKVTGLVSTTKVAEKRILDFESQTIVDASVLLLPVSSYKTNQS